MSRRLVSKARVIVHKKFKELNEKIFTAQAEKMTFDTSIDSVSSDIQADIKDLKEWVFAIFDDKCGEED
jgi:hypothetical protein